MNRSKRHWIGHNNCILSQQQAINPVVHFEIPADDRERAVGFYGEVFDWVIESIPIADDTYLSVITSPLDDEYRHEASGAINGAVIDRDDSISTPIITIDVPSIDEHRERIEAQGGSILVEKVEVPNMGYYAYFEDSEGNVLGLWETMESPD